MNHSEQQDQDDLEVFQEFARSGGGPGEYWESVKHASEPVPDVVCQSEDVVTYYELTQVDPVELIQPCGMVPIRSTGSVPKPAVADFDGVASVSREVSWLRL